jgi:hypothetical protein
MWGAWTVVLNLASLMARLPCMPVELGQIPVEVPAPPPSDRPPAPATALSSTALPSTALPSVVVSPPQPPFPPLPVPVAMREDARYRIAFGPLGQVGEIRTTIRDDRAEGTEQLVQVGGYGEGSIFGLGRMRSQVDSQFNLRLLGSRRWTAARWKGDQTTTDIIEQPRPGVVTLERRRDGRPPDRQAASFPLPAFDPLGFLMRVRIAPPAPGQTQTFQVFEGRALWRVTLTTAGTQALPDSDAALPALRLEGRFDPIRYDGHPDSDDRPHRTFTLWLSNDAARVPLRLSVPIGIVDVVVELVELQRQARD